MQPWQTLLVAGNNYLNQQQWHLAENAYQAAEVMLSESWEKDVTNEQLLNAWITANHNLAILYEMQGEHKISFQYLVLAHKRVLLLAQARHLPKHAMTMIIEAIKTTLMPITLFRNKYPICDHCITAIMEVKQLVNETDVGIH